MSSRLGILCLHVFTYTSLFVFLPLRCTASGQSMCFRAWYDSLDTTPLKGISLLGVYIWQASSKVSVWYI